MLSENWIVSLSVSLSLCGCVCVLFFIQLALVQFFSSLKSSISSGKHYKWERRMKMAHSFDEKVRITNRLSGNEILHERERKREPHMAEDVLWVTCFSIVRLTRRIVTRESVWKKRRRREARWSVHSKSEGERERQRIARSKKLQEEKDDESSHFLFFLSFFFRLFFFLPEHEALVRGRHRHTQGESERKRKWYRQRNSCNAHRTWICRPEFPEHFCLTKWQENCFKIGPNVTGNKLLQ